MEPSSRSFCHRIARCSFARKMCVKSFPVLIGRRFTHSRPKWLSWPSVHRDRKASTSFRLIYLTRCHILFQGRLHCCYSRVHVDFQLDLITCTNVPLPLVRWRKKHTRPDFDRKFPSQLMRNFIRTSPVCVHRRQCSHRIIQSNKRRAFHFCGGFRSGFQTQLLRLQHSCAALSVSKLAKVPVCVRIMRRASSYRQQRRFSTSSFYQSK